MDVAGADHACRSQCRRTATSPTSPTNQAWLYVALLPRSDGLRKLTIDAQYFNAAAPSFDGSTTPRQQQPINSMSRSFSTYTFPFQATSSSMDHGLQALLSGHVSREPSVVYANPIANFYHDANGPWNSIRATSQARSLTPNAALSVPVPNLDYNSYRHAPASDVSDSGYASQAAASLPVVNLEPTDYNRECGDLPLQVNSFSFTAASSGSPAYDVQSFGAQSQDGHVQNPLLCTRCGETAKCPSDFKCVFQSRRLAPSPLTRRGLGNMSSSTSSRLCARSPDAPGKKASPPSMT